MNKRYESAPWSIDVYLLLSVIGFFVTLGFAFAKRPDVVDYLLARYPHADRAQVETLYDRCVAINAVATAVVGVGTLNRLWKGRRWTWISFAVSNVVGVVVWPALLPIVGAKAIFLTVLEAVLLALLLTPSARRFCGAYNFIGRFDSRWQPPAEIPLQRPSWVGAVPVPPVVPTVPATAPADDDWPKGWRR